MNLSLSDPLTWVGVLIASFVIAGLRWLQRRRPAPRDQGADQT